jgi:hypothetical protein
MILILPKKVRIDFDHKFFLLRFVKKKNIYFKKCFHKEF